MLKLSIVEFIVRAIPEMFTLVLAAYMLAGEKIKLKRYLLTSTLLCIGVFFIRMLPITFGVHTILNIILMTILITGVSKVNSVKAIKSSMIITVVMICCEVLNILLISKVFLIDVAKISSNVNLKTIYGYPSLIFFIIYTALYYKFIYSKKVAKGV